MFTLAKGYASSIKLSIRKVLTSSRTAQSIYLSYMSYGNVHILLCGIGQSLDLESVGYWQLDLMMTQGNKKPSCPTIVG